MAKTTRYDLESVEALVEVVVIVRIPLMNIGPCSKTLDVARDELEADGAEVQIRPDQLIVGHDYDDD